MTLCFGNRRTAPEKRQSNLIESSQCGKQILVSWLMRIFTCTHTRTHANGKSTWMDVCVWDSFGLTISKCTQNIMKEMDLMRWAYKNWAQTYINNLTRLNYVFWNYFTFWLWPLVAELNKGVWTCTEQWFFFSFFKKSHWYSWRYILSNESVYKYKSRSRSNATVNSGNINSQLSIETKRVAKPSTNCINK